MEAVKRCKKSKYVYKCTRKISWDRHGVVDRTLTLNSGGPEFEHPSHANDFINEYCHP